MPQVVCKLSKPDHAALKQRAKANLRTAGNQLLAEAFAKNGLELPAYLSAPTKSGKLVRGKIIRKGERV